ncbi:DUF6113 family protein [Nonomuraea ferruginea]|uniref:DUF6113 family protein n=1 Tax=Nonomuraea ferruginea TaxID=46174 RepID=A0ABT4SW34_9ACTN|nr:DUF6113 family protein [Nonomuraea ferruginea]MDA0641392.1 DUF6113 family protein [Nonomuraea ferruginea]
MEQRSQVESALGGAAYGMLFVLGVVMGVVGGFTHSAWPGLPVVSAVLWLVLIFGVSLGAGRLMGGRAAAAVTSAGWVLVSSAFSLRLGAGDLVIAGDASGHVYLYGGMVAAVAAFLMLPSSGGSWLLRGYPEEGSAPPGRVQQGR